MPENMPEDTSEDTPDRTPAGTCHVVSAGPTGGFSPVIGARDFLIAADAGYLACVDAGLEPDFVIGDFDSMAIEEFEGAACEHETLPTAKDDTDTIAALREGLRRGYRRFEIHCALGGDVGHELANVQALLFLRERGARGVLHGEGQTLFAVFPEDGEVAVPTRRGERVSVLAFAGNARGVCEHGLRWELDGGELDASFPLGVSNEATGARATFSVAQGQLLVVCG